jgi:hypothetical protein
MKRFALFLAFLSFAISFCNAQPNADAGGAAAGFYGSAGKTGSGGGFISLYSTGGIRSFGSPGIQLELGLAGPTPATAVDGQFAINWLQSINTDRNPIDDKRRHAFFYLIGGYSRYFVTGNAADYGAGVNWRLKSKTKIGEWKAIRLEYRENYVFGWGRQPGIRISYETGSDIE